MTSVTRRPATGRAWERLVGWLILAVIVSVATLAIVAEPVPLRVLSSYPADRAVLDQPPASATVSLDGMLRPAEYHLSVRPATGGALVSTAPARLDGQSLMVPVRIVATGSYLAAYHVRLEDGRELSGITRFSVAGNGPAAAPPPPAAAPPTAHVHGLAGDPLTVVLLLVDVVLVAVLVVVMAWQRRRPRRTS